MEIGRLLMSKTKNNKIIPFINFFIEKFLLFIAIILTDQLS